MKSTVETKSKTQHLVKVEIPAEVVSTKLTELFRQAAREIALPGFRPGHVPRAVLEARFGKDFLNDDAKEGLIREHLPKVLDEHKLKPVSTPQATDVGQFSDGNPFIFTIEIEVLPELDVENYIGLELEEPAPRTLTEEEINAVLDRLRVDHAAAVPRASEERAAQEDIVTVRTENSQESQEIQVSSEGLTSAYVGKSVGDWVELAFENGKKIRTKIEIIKRLEKPDDEELANTLGHGSPTEMIEKIRHDLSERYERQRQRELRMALLDKILAQTPVEIPPRMLDEVVRRELEILQRGGYPEPTADEVKKLKASTEKRLQREIIVRAIKTQEKLELNDQDFEASLKSDAEKREMNPIKFRAILEREGRLTSYRAELEDERVLQFLVDNAQLKKKES